MSDEPPYVPENSFQTAAMVSRKDASPTATTIATAIFCLTSSASITFYVDVSDRPITTRLSAACCAA